MKKVNRLAAALFFVAAMLLGGSLSAQDEGTYIDNASSQDSSSTEGVDLNLDESSQGKSKGNTATYIGFGVVLAGAAAFILLRKKKK